MVTLGTTGTRRHPRLDASGRLIAPLGNLRPSILLIFRPPFMKLFRAVRQPAIALLVAAATVAGAAGTAGAAFAQASVGVGVAAYRAGEYKKALDVLELHAIRGNAEAQYLMGEMREQGLGIEASRERALFWYGQAAAQGHVAARAALETIGGAQTGNFGEAGAR